MESLSAATAQSFHLLFSGDAALWIIIFTSFSVSVRAILIAAPFAFLAAFLMAHLRYPGRRAMIAGFSALQSIPAVVVGLTVYLLFFQQQRRSGEFREDHACILSVVLR